MERIRRIFNKEFSKISEAAFVLGSFTLLSQILAIFRDRLLAGNIGTGMTLDVYYAAFRIPDLIFTLGASFLSVSILMPFFKSKMDESEYQGKKFLNSIFTVFFLVITVISILVAIALPYFSESLFPGFSPKELSDTIMLSRVMLLSPILLGISNLFATITQAYKKFFVYALAPVVYNLGIIIGILAFFPLFGVVGLAYGVILGALFHMLIQIPVVVQQGLFPRFNFAIVWADIRTVIYHSFPRTVTLSMSKIVFLIFISIASTLASGTISVFNLAYNLQSVPLAIIGVSYSVAAFPVLVDFFKNKNFEQFMSHVMGPIRQIVFWSLPVIALFVVLRAQIVRVILGTGQFDWSDTRLTAASLALFIISVVAQSIELLLIRAYYAAGRTWKPLVITISSSMVTILMAFVFTYVYTQFSSVQSFFESLLRIEGVPGSSVVMLSLAYSVGMFINMIALWIFFKKDFGWKPGYGVRKSFIQSALASSTVGLVAYLSLQYTQYIFNEQTVFGVFGHGFVSGLLGIIAGFILLKYMKNHEIEVFVEFIKRKYIQFTNK